MIEKDDKKKLPKKHMEDLDKLDKSLAEGQGIVREKIEQDKKIYDGLDKARSHVNKEKKIALVFSSTGGDDISESSWGTYGRMVDRTANICTSVEALVRDLSIPKESAQLGTAAGMLDTLLSSSEATPSLTFKGDPFLAKRLSPLEEPDTINDHTEFIKSELNTICPDKITTFEKILIDWKTANPEIKYTSLLDLRSLIFYQVLDNLCEESKYSKSPWFRGGKKRFCQAKYFMFRNNDERSLISAIRIQIDSIANDMQKYFDDLSEYGKHGHNQASTDGLFSDVLLLFSQCLRMRKIYCIK